MSDKFSIDDSIVLDPQNIKSNNFKKILVSIAILVLLFLIIIIIMKMINSGSETSDDRLVMPSEEVIFKSTVDELKQSAKVVEIKPLEEPKKESEQRVVVEKVVEKPIQKPAQKVEEKPAEKQVQKPSKQVETPVKKTEPVKTEPKEEVVVVTAKKTEPKKVEAKKVEAKKVEPAKTEQTKAPKPEPKPAIKGSMISGAIPSGAYVQVLATSNFKPDADYINKLTTNGYNYRLLKTTVNGKEFTKVLVGPYSQSDIQKEISKIRATINKDAFVFRVK